MEEQLKNILADLLGIDEKDITEQFSYRDTDAWDSLKHMEIVTAIEQNFDVTFTADEIVKMTGFREIKDILKNKGIGV